MSTIRLNPREEFDVGDPRSFSDTAELAEDDIFDVYGFSIVAWFLFAL